jgi:Holliday junction resolvase RusA-like endonuclease
MEKLVFLLQFEPNPPTVTHQEKKVRVVKGKPIFYMPAELAAARSLLAAKLKPFAPATPIEGPIHLGVSWAFTRPKSVKGDWKITKPDTDNLQKMLKDVMTECGFWKDDAQVCSENIEKIYRNADEKHGILILIKSLH